MVVVYNFNCSIMFSYYFGRASLSGRVCVTALDGLRNGGLSLVDVVAEGLEARRHQHIGGVRVHQLLLPLPLYLAGAHVGDAPRHLHEEAIEGAPGSVDEAPRFTAVEEDDGGHSLGGVDLGEPPPNLTYALEVTPDGRLVAVVLRDDPAQVLENLHQTSF